MDERSLLTLLQKRPNEGMKATEPLAHTLQPRGLEPLPRNPD